MFVLSLAKLAGTDQRYYLDQAGGRVDHTGSVASGVEDYYLGGPEAAGRWTGSAAPALGLDGEVPEAELRAVLSQEDPRSGDKLSGPAARARVPGYDLMFSVPKSASVLFGIGDPRVQRAVIATRPAIRRYHRSSVMTLTAPPLEHQPTNARAQSAFGRPPDDAACPAGR